MDVKGLGDSLPGIPGAWQIRDAGLPAEYIGGSVEGSAGIVSSHTKGDRSGWIQTSSRTLA